MAHIKINGTKQEIKDGILLEDFLKSIELPKIYVVELNKEIIYKEQYGNLILKDSDEIEIAAFCGGG